MPKEVLEEELDEAGRPCAGIEWGAAILWT